MKVLLGFCAGMQFGLFLETKSLWHLGLCLACLLVNVVTLKEADNAR